ncbi:hypothetical protein NSU_0077 [Novosphingobium pentaromativorans US6-1]|uniref:Uncharacterized protein n=1 Tax=Novosphingobium pentaromativorans US6-1 TaxID=1088721 RepID=G6E6V7_9SPHN|nr:hypothetical protein NSU_0077 [Novosphingobium pentaromativorans US6-1]
MKNNRTACWTVIDTHENSNAAPGFFDGSVQDGARSIIVEEG